MSDEVLENYIKGHFEANTEKGVMFSWHGGEPTLAGIGFFRKVIEIQKKHRPSGIKIVNGIQTNGILLDENWCAFLAEEELT